MIKLKTRTKEKQKKKETNLSLKRASTQIGMIHIKFRENNMIFTLTDLRGNTFSTVSGGSLGYKNAQKSTWTTARECAVSIGKKAHALGFARLYINIRGLCTKRQSILRVFEPKRTGCKIVRVIYRTALPHNGCRGFKKGRK